MEELANQLTPEQQRDKHALLQVALELERAYQEEARTRSERIGKSQRLSDLYDAVGNTVWYGMTPEEREQVLRYLPKDPGHDR